MSDDNSSATATPRPRNEQVEDAVIVDGPETTDTRVVEPVAAAPVTSAPVWSEQAPSTPAAETPVTVEPVATSATEPVIATVDPAAAATDASPRVVYVQVPSAPRQQGNRGVGSLIALVSALVFTALLAVITAALSYASSGVLSFGFLARAEFYIPTLFFVIAFVLLVLLANRAKWWAFIIGSLVVGVVVYFGTVGLGLLTGGVVLLTPAEASLRFQQSLASPFVIVSALLAREVALWTGGIISRRGVRLRTRNLESRAAYDRELATARAEHERANTTASPAV